VTHEFCNILFFDVLVHSDATNSFFSRSAAKARQALIFSEVSSEKSSKISASVIPPDRYSNTQRTGAGRLKRGVSPHKFVEAGVCLTNRITDVLKGYYPQVLDWFTDKNTLVFCELLMQWSTLEAAQQAALKTLNQFFVEQHCRYKKTNAARIEKIKSATPLTHDRDILEPSQWSCAKFLRQRFVQVG
jgi:hypothetical protein